MDRRVIEINAFVISSKIFLEESLALTCLSPEGLLSCYDHYFFKNYKNFWPYLKESHFRLSLSPTSKHTQYYLKSLSLHSHLDLEGEDLELWSFFSDFVFFYSQYPEYSHHFYSFYDFLYKVMLQKTVSNERKYFYYTYTFFHLLDRCREGCFLDHCREILRDLSEKDRQKWQVEFSEKRLCLHSFQNVLSYLRSYCYNAQPLRSHHF